MSHLAHTQLKMKVTPTITFQLSAVDDGRFPSEVGMGYKQHCIACTAVRIHVITTFTKVCGENGHKSIAVEISVLSGIEPQ
jgi:hypothetical protein